MFSKAKLREVLGLRNEEIKRLRYDINRLKVDLNRAVVARNKACSMLHHELTVERESTGERWLVCANCTFSRQL